MAAMEVAMAVEVVAMAAETAVAMDVPRVAVELVVSAVAGEALAVMMTRATGARCAHRPQH